MNELASSIGVIVTDVFKFWVFSIAVKTVNILVRLATEVGILLLIIAEHFGGKGHDAAASSPIKSELKETIINLFLNKEN